MCDSSASVAVLTTSTMTTSPALQSVPEPPDGQATSTAMTSATPQSVPEPHRVLATSVAAPQSVPETGNKRSFKKRNVKQKKPAAKRQKRERSSSTDDTPCCICQRKYNEPPFEDWQQCRICGQWFHDSCGPGDSDADVCYFCLE